MLVKRPRVVVSTWMIISVESALTILWRTPLSSKSISALESVLSYTGIQIQYSSDSSSNAASATPVTEGNSLAAMNVNKQSSNSQFDSSYVEANAIT